MFFSAISAGNSDSKYDSVPYKCWEYLDCPRNTKERSPLTESKASRQHRVSRVHADTEYGDGQAPLSDPQNLVEEEILSEQMNMPTLYQILMPRYLCIFTDYVRAASTIPTDGVQAEYLVIETQTWLQHCKTASYPEYMFFGYTETQFDCNENEEDYNALIELAVKATRDAGLQAFWISTNCIHDENDCDDESIIEDVWRMSDVVRGCKAMAILLRQPIESREQGRPPSFREMMRGWGERMWTLPEILLCPSGVPVRIYVWGRKEFEQFEKRRLPAELWKDATIARCLMDHFEGSVILSPLELVIIALKCLSSRHVTQGEVSAKLHGEMSYVLMGLLRRRPAVNVRDTAIQAFARLSLANDSHQLLERLMCVMPKSRQQAWHDTADHWEARLWDIYPTCQVAGITSHDRILLDGVYGATIHWERFSKFSHSIKGSFLRKVAKAILLLSPILVFIALIATAATSGGTRVLAIIVLVICVIFLGFSPRLITLLFSGKIWNPEPKFFGFEGYMDLGTIERHLLGLNKGRLSWSPYNSTLSHHGPGKYGECVGRDPMDVEATRKLVRDAYHPTAPTPPETHVFTLVDTFTMTVTLFEAQRPPVAILVCGSEGGMQRAILASYRPDTHCFYKETVMRMETMVLDKMHRVHRLLFSIKSSSQAHSS
jgi:hypothetical protein